MSEKLDWVRLKPMRVRRMAEVFTDDIGKEVNEDEPVGELVVVMCDDEEFGLFYVQSGAYMVKGQVWNTWKLRPVKTSRVSDDLCLGATNRVIHVQLFRYLGDVRIKHEVRRVRTLSDAKIMAVPEVVR